MRKWSIVHIPKIGSVCCDAEGCDYVATEIPVKVYKAWINKPCPKCGANLLTQIDYDNSRKIFRLMRCLNILFGWIGLIFGVRDENDPRNTAVSVRTINGKIIVKDKEP